MRRRGEARATIGWTGGGRLEVRVKARSGHNNIALRVHFPFIAGELG